MCELGKYIQPGFKFKVESLGSCMKAVIEQINELYKVIEKKDVRISTLEERVKLLEDITNKKSETNQQFDDQNRIKDENENVINNDDRDWLSNNVDMNSKVCKNDAINKTLNIDQVSKKEYVMLNKNKSLAEIIKSNIKAKPKENVIKFKVKEKNEELKQLQNIKIKKLTDKNNEIYIECADEKNAKEAIDKLKTINVEASMKEKRIPMMKIKNLSNDLKQDEIISSIINKNEDINDLINEKETLEIIHVNKKKDYNDVIIKVSPKMREQIIKNKNKIYIQINCVMWKIIYMYTNALNANILDTHSLIAKKNNQNVYTALAITDQRNVIPNMIKIYINALTVH